MWRDPANTDFVLFYTTGLMAAMPLSAGRCHRSPADDRLRPSSALEHTWRGSNRFGGLDVKLALRLMRKSWGLTLVGGVAMAVTIGLGTSIFTIWNTATATTLPLPDGDRIVAIQTFDAATQQIHRDSSLQDLRRWRERLRSVTDVSAARRVQRTLATPDGAAGPISVAEMTASAFRLVRVLPLLGRPCSTTMNAAARTSP